MGRRRRGKGSADRLLVHDGLIRDMELAREDWVDCDFINVGGGRAEIGRGWGPDIFLWTSIINGESFLKMLFET